MNNAIETSEAVTLNALENIRLPSASAQRRKLLFICCFISTLTGGTVSTLLSVYLPVIMTEILPSQGAENAAITGWLNASLIFGWTAGGILWGILCDKIGRRKAFIFSTACYGLFTLFTAISSSWWLLALNRFGTGLGVGGVLVTTTILISETFDKKQRAVLLGILSISFPIGIFSAGLINYLFAQWRPAFGVGLIPLIISIIAWFGIRESLLWKSINKNESPVPTSTVFKPPYRGSLIMGSIIFGTALIGLWATFSWLPSWVQTLLINSDGQKERGVTMMLMGSGGLIGGFVSGWMVNALGLKKTMLIVFATCFILSAILFMLTTTISPLVYSGIAVLAVFFGISQGALSIYIPSLFPVNIGATATGLCFNIGRIFTAASVFFIGSLVILLGGYGHAMFIFSFVFLPGFFATLFNKPVRY